MKLVVLAAFGLVLSLLAVSSTAAVDFDFYYFVQQWPGSYCHTKDGCCFPDGVEREAKFSIHGLWPSYAARRYRDGDHDDLRRRHGLARAVLGEDVVAALPFSAVGRQGKYGPVYCNNNNPLSPSDIGDLVASLNQKWPTLSCKKDMRESFNFWSYEWKKHGTCSNLKQYDYFARSLALQAEYDLTAILASAGIVPSDEKTYSLSSLRDAIDQGTGFTAYLKCNLNAHGEAQLSEVSICVDKRGKKLIDCPRSSSCPDTVKLPASLPSA